MHSAEFMASHSPLDCTFLMGMTAVQREAYMEVIEETLPQAGKMPMGQLDGQPAMQFGADFKNMFAYFQNENTSNDAIDPSQTLDVDNETLIATALDVLSDQEEQAITKDIFTSTFNENTHDTSEESKQAWPLSTFTQEPDSFNTLRHQLTQQEFLKQENIEVSLAIESGPVTVGNRIAGKEERDSQTISTTPLETITSPLHDESQLLAHGTEIVIDRSNILEFASEVSEEMPYEQEQVISQASEDDTAYEQVFDSAPSIDEAPAIDQEKSEIIEFDEDFTTFYTELQFLLSESEPNAAIEQGILPPSPLLASETQEATEQVDFEPLELVIGQLQTEKDFSPELTEALDQLREAIEEAKQTPNVERTTETLLTPEIIKALAEVLHQAGAEEPKQLILQYARAHSAKELVELIKTIEPDFAKLTDFQHYLLRVLNQSLQDATSPTNPIGKFLLSLVRLTHPVAKQAA